MDSYPVDCDRNAILGQPCIDSDDLPARQPNRLARKARDSLTLYTRSQPSPLATLLKIPSEDEEGDDDEANGKCRSSDSKTEAGCQTVKVMKIEREPSEKVRFTRLEMVNEEEEGEEEEEEKEIDNQEEKKERQGQEENARDEQLENKDTKEENEWSENETVEERAEKEEAKGTENDKQTAEGGKEPEALLFDGDSEMEDDDSEEGQEEDDVIADLVLSAFSGKPNYQTALSRRARDSLLVYQTPKPPSNAEAYKSVALSSIEEESDEMDIGVSEPIEDKSKKYDLNESKPNDDYPREEVSKEDEPNQVGLEHEPKEDESKEDKLNEDEPKKDELKENDPNKKQTKRKSVTKDATMVTRATQISSSAGHAQEVGWFNSKWKKLTKWRASASSKST